MKEIIPLTSTVIGSYPTPMLNGEEGIKFAVDNQIRAGIDIISDGQTRKDMIKYFTDHIPGFTFEDNKIKIIDKIHPPKESPLTKDLKFVKNMIGKEKGLKGIITGPVTLIASSKIDKKSPYSSFLDPILYDDLGEALKKEAELIIKSGIDILQIDEPFYSVGAPLDLGIRSIKIITENIKIPVGMHVCGNVTKVFEKLVLFPGIDILSLEFAGSKENFSVIDKRLLEKNSKILGVGCIDSKSNKIDSVKEIINLLNKAIEKVGLNSIMIHPDCGLKLLDPDNAYHKLKNMVEAIKKYKK